MELSFGHWSHTAFDRLDRGTLYPDEDTTLHLSGCLLCDSALDILKNMLEALSCIVFSIGYGRISLLSPGGVLEHMYLHWRHAWFDRSKSPLCGCREDDPEAGSDREASMVYGLLGVIWKDLFSKHSSWTFSEVALHTRTYRRIETESI